MKLLLQTTDHVLISYVTSVLAGEAIEAAVFDQSMSAIEGSIGAFPRRIMVAEADYPRARTALWAAGLKDELASGEAP